MAAFQRREPTIADINSWANGQARRGESVCRPSRTASAVVLAPRCFRGFRAPAPATSPQSGPCSAAKPPSPALTTVRLVHTVVGLRFGVCGASFVSLF